MQAFIKRRSDFKTLPVLNVIDYDITLESIYDENSTFTVAGEYALNQGDFIFFDGHGWIIQQADPAEGVTQITCVDMVNLFARSIVYPGVGTDIESFIAAEISSNFSGIADTAYNMPYIAVTAATSTAFIEPEVKDGVYSLKSYTALVRRLANIFVSFAVAGNTLAITIEARPVVTRKIDFADDAHRLTAESYSASSIAKVTAVELIDGVVARVRDFYLMADGTITETPGTAERAVGDWTVITIASSSGSGGGDMLASVYADSPGVVKDSAKLNGKESTYYTPADAVPTALADLTDDADHRLVTDTEKETWNGSTDAAELLTKIKTVDGANSGLDADLLDGVQFRQLAWFQSQRNFVNGTLIITNVVYPAASGAAFLLEIIGNSYGDLQPYSCKAQGYVWQNSLINVGGTIVGVRPTAIKALSYNGVLCFWFATQAYWQGFSVFCSDTNAKGYRLNTVTDIIDSGLPTGYSNAVDITLTAH